MTPSNFGLLLGILVCTAAGLGVLYFLKKDYKSSSAAWQDLIGIILTIVVGLGLIHVAQSGRMDKPNFGSSVRGGRYYRH